MKKPFTNSNPYIVNAQGKDSDDFYPMVAMPTEQDAIEEADRLVDNCGYYGAEVVYMPEHDDDINDLIYRRQGRGKRWYREG